MRNGKRHAEGGKVSIRESDEIDRVILTPFAGKIETGTGDQRADEETQTPADTDPGSDKGTKAGGDHLGRVGNAASLESTPRDTYGRQHKRRRGTCLQ